MRTWVNVSEAAEYAGVSRDTIYSACERRELRNARLSGRRAIRISLWKRGRQYWTDFTVNGRRYRKRLGTTHLRVPPAASAR